MGIHHLDIEDMIYGLEYEKAIEALNKGYNHSSFALSELLEMLEILKFYDDKDSLKEEYKNKLLSFKKEISFIKKSVGIYFGRLSGEKIINDLREIKLNHDLHPQSYLETLERYKAFKNIDSNEFEDILNEGLLSLDSILRQPAFSQHFVSNIKKIMLESDSGITFLVSQYDEESSLGRKKQKYYLPSFNMVEVDEMIGKYLNSPYVNLNYLHCLKLHKDSVNSYKISRKKRIEIENKIEAETEKLFSNGNSVSYGFGVNIDPEQEQPIVYKGNPPDTIISFSAKFLKSNLTNDKIMAVLINIMGFIDAQGRITSIYKPNKEDSLMKVLGIRNKDEYGSDTSRYMFNCLQLIFTAYYQFLINNKIKLENVFEWFVTNMINNNLENCSIKLNLLKEGDALSKCERLFNELPSLLTQYDIYCEESVVNESMMKANRGFKKVFDIGCLANNKYYEVVSNSELTSIMSIMFSDQCMLNYLNEKVNGKSFVDLLRKHPIKNSDYKTERTKRLLDILSSNDIISFDEEGYILPSNKEKIGLLETLYEYGYIEYRRIKESAQSILNEFMNKGWLKIRNNLFATPEADYLSYSLDNSKYSNAIALRNNYEHGNGKLFTDEENQKNYLLGMRLMLEILAKIHSDIYEFKFLGDSSNNVKR